MDFTFTALFIVGLLTAEFGRIFSSGQLAQSASEVHLREKRETASSSFFYYQEPRYPRDCKELYEQCDGEVTESGIYTIQPDSSPQPFEVYCNNSIDGGGWTVFQRRVDGAVEFYRSWAEYKAGFGFTHREFWMGNDKLAYLTNQKDYELRIDFVNRNGNPYFAKYGLFRISDESSKYRLVNIEGYLSGSTTNRDSFARHLNMSFSTYDSDNDIHSSYHCASHWHGAWWYADCIDSNLNGHYFACRDCHQSIFWRGLPESGYNIAYTEMKVRPVTTN